MGIACARDGIPFVHLVLCLIAGTRITADGFSYSIFSMYSKIAVVTSANVYAIKTVVHRLQYNSEVGENPHYPEA